jgi:hypothetical protein
LRTSWPSDGDRPQIGLVEAGYLFLATDSGAGAAADNHMVQRAADADIVLMSPDDLRVHAFRGCRTTASHWLRSDNPVKAGSTDPL